MEKINLNICLLLPDDFSEEMPARPAVTEIYGKYLSLNHNVTWVCPSKKSYAQLFDLQKYKQVNVYLISHPTCPGLMLKFFNFIMYYYKLYKLMVVLFTKEDFDIIQVRNDVFSALIAIHFKNKYHIPFVFQYSFPKDAFKFRKRDTYYFFGILQNHLLKYILKYTDLIFPISKWMESKLIKEGISKSKMMPLPMGVNPELFDFKIDSSKIRKRYCLTDSKVLLYVGSMDKLRSLDPIIHAFSYVLKINPNTKLLMVGDGNDKSHLEELSEELGISKNIIFTGKISYFEIPYYISSADICLSPIKPLDIYKVSSPTKLFESMVMCKPVVANKEIPEQKEVIEKAGCGVLVKFESESFAEGIIDLLSDPELAEDMGQKGYKWVIENRSYESMAHDVETQYFKLFKSSRGF